VVIGTIPLILGTGAVAAIAGVIFVSSARRIVPANEAHVLVTKKGKSIKMSRQGLTPAYYYVSPNLPLFGPIFGMRVHKIPMSNQSISINNIDLYDQNVAPFRCDMTIFVRVKDPEVAAERWESLEELENQIRQIVESSSRSVTMSHTILENMRDRKALNDRIENEIQDELPKWGLELVDTEIVEIEDRVDPETGAKTSHVIENISKKESKKIQSESRQVIAEQEKLAKIREAETEEKWKTREIERDEAVEKRRQVKEETVGLREQQKEEKIAEAQEKRYKQTIEAARTQDVGLAKVEKEATIERAEGEAQAIEKTGKAEADVVKMKMSAEGEGYKKQAEGLKEYNEAGITIQKVDADVKVQEAWAKAFGEAMSNADVQWVVAGKPEAGIRGMFSPEGGASLGQFIKSFQATGGDLGKLISTVKNAVPGLKEEKNETVDK